MVFKNRIDAGKRLAKALVEYEEHNPIVLAIPRGGVIIGYEISIRLKCPIDIVIPRKIGAPFQPELAIGAVTEDGTIYLNDHIIRSLNVKDSYIKEESLREIKEIGRRMRLYRGDTKSNLDMVNGRTVILTDDGIATGATMKAALTSIRKYNPRRIIEAIPVGPLDTIKEMRSIADEVISIHIPEQMSSIGEFYDNFDQVNDDVVIEILEKGGNISTQTI